jgi:uncharacterized tellurite resistance protein B-like protein
MLRALTELVDSLMTPTGKAEPVSVELATAVLLVEVMRADTNHDAAERGLIRNALQRRFGMAASDVDELMALAEQKSREANDFFAFTSLLNERLDHAQKIEVIETMWHVAFADGNDDPWERNILNRVAGLLHVTHGEYIAAKLRARQAMQPPG